MDRLDFSEPTLRSSARASTGGLLTIALVAGLLGCPAQARAQTPPAPLLAPTAPPAAWHRKPRPAFWVAAGVAGASLATGIVLDQLAVRDLDRYRLAPSSELRHRGETRALVSDVSFGVAGVTAVVALVLLVIDCTADASGQRRGRREGVTLGATGQGLTVGF